MNEHLDKTDILANHVAWHCSTMGVGDHALVTESKFPHYASQHFFNHETTLNL